jgi:parallel beta-helix repeat protein
LQYSGHNRVVSNTTKSNTWYNIILENSSENEIDNNKTSTSDVGIAISSNNNEISNNDVRDNINGIYLYENCHHNHIYDNNVMNNYHAIRLVSDCSDNTVTGNDIIDSNYGIDLDQSSNNRIFLNRFFRSSYGHVISTSSVNFWNSLEELTYVYDEQTLQNYIGNYWDDYLGIDADNDGIGDTPHITNDIQDNYPLLGAFDTPGSVHGGYAVIFELLPSSTLSIDGGILEPLLGSFELEYMGLQDVGGGGGKNDEFFELSNLSLHTSSLIFTQVPSWVNEAYNMYNESNEWLAGGFQLETSTVGTKYGV